MELTQAQQDRLQELYECRDWEGYAAELAAIEAAQ